MSLSAIKTKLQELSIGLRVAIDQYSTQKQYQDWARVWIKDFKEACALNEPQDEESKEEKVSSITNSLLRDYYQQLEEIRTGIEKQLVSNRARFDYLKNLEPSTPTKIGLHVLTYDTLGQKQRQFYDEIFMTIIKQSDQLIRSEKLNNQFNNNLKSFLDALVIKTL